MKFEATTPPYQEGDLVLVFNEQSELVWEHVIKTEPKKPLELPKFFWHNAVKPR